VKKNEKGMQTLQDLGRNMARLMEKLFT